MTNNDYQKATEKRDELQRKVEDANKQFEPFKEYRKSNGSLPGWVKNSGLYYRIQLDYNEKFKDLQDFNTVYVKKYKKEIEADRRSRLQEVI
tara:strand:- start:30 stop:305 length:276 start_codon:yes stop_codon:yes gene_type:complete